MIRCLIADDHPLLRDALVRLLRAVVPGADIAEAADLAGVEALLQGPTPQLLLVDLHMPGMGGVVGVRRLRRLWPALPLVVVSAEQDAGVIRAVCAAGAVAFLPKSEAPAVMQQVLRLVLEGGSCLPGQALADLRPGAAPPGAGATGLTPRQRDVLRALMRGAPNKEIARELGLGEGTVKIHVAAVLRALRARNRTEAVVAARALGLEP